jgi:hypothetical protein
MNLDLLAKCHRQLAPLLGDVITHVERSSARRFRAKAREYRATEEEHSTIRTCETGLGGSAKGAIRLQILSPIVAPS